MVYKSNRRIYRGEMIAFLVVVAQVIMASIMLYLHIFDSISCWMIMVIMSSLGVMMMPYILEK